MHDQLVQGWVAVDEGGEGIEVVLKGDGEYIAETVANVYRKDVFDLGLHASGYCGFKFWDLGDALRSFTNLSVHLKVDDSLIAQVEQEKIESIFDESLPLIFLHIPKTAGTSFRLAANDIFNQDAVWLDYGPESESTTPEVMATVHGGSKESLLKQLKENKVKFYSGHFTVEDYLSLFGRQARWCTFFRDPVQRVLSDYKHVVRNYGVKKSLEEFCQLEWQKNEQYKCARGLSLKDFYFIGLTEEYDRSIKVFNALTGLSVPYLEMNKGKPSIAEAHQDTNEIMALIRRCNQQDIEFYEQAREEFECRAQKLGV
ncbi:MAG: sulfotransferase family 2 domain-containing protein [Spongiibacteraceae bacterium]